MHNWRRVIEYYIQQGFPEKLLWFICINPYEAYQICNIIERTHPRTLLEIGSFIGLSTGVLALASPSESRLICVDPNLPVNVLSQRFHYSEGRGALWFVRNMLEHFQQDQKVILLEGSLSPLSADYRDRLIALGGNTESIAQVGESLREFAPFDLVFVDGDHHEESVYADLSSVCQYLSKDALIILHDLSGYWGIHVFTGVNRFLQEHSEFSLQVHENLGFLFRRSNSISTLINQLY